MQKITHLRHRSTNGVRLTPSPHQNLHRRHESKPTPPHAATITNHPTRPAGSRILLAAISSPTYNTRLPRTYGVPRGVRTTSPLPIEAQPYREPGNATLSARSHPQSPNLTHATSTHRRHSRLTTHSCFVRGVATPDLLRRGRGEERQQCAEGKGAQRRAGQGPQHALRDGHPFSRGMGPRPASCCDCPAVEQSSSLAPTCPSRSAWHNPCGPSLPLPLSLSRSLCEPRTPTHTHRPQPSPFLYRSNQSVGAGRVTRVAPLMGELSRNLVGVPHQYATHLLH